MTLRYGLSPTGKKEWVGGERSPTPAARICKPQVVAQWLVPATNCSGAQLESSSGVAERKWVLAELVNGKVRIQMQNPHCRLTAPAWLRLCANGIRKQKRAACGQMHYEGALAREGLSTQRSFWQSVIATIRTT